MNIVVVNKNLTIWRLLTNDVRWIKNVFYTADNFASTNNTKKAKKSNNFLKRLYIYV